MGKISVYFFVNGKPFKPPHRVTIDEKQLQNNKVIERVNRLYYYNGYVVYTLVGQLLRTVGEIHDEAAFVAVPRDECFQPGPYTKMFRDYINTKLPSELKPKKKKKPLTKPIGSSYGCKGVHPRLAKEVRFCPGCRHVAVGAKCKDFKQQGKRSKKDTCQCEHIEAHAKCIPGSEPKFKPKRRKKKSTGCSACCRKKEQKRELWKPKHPIVKQQTQPKKKRRTRTCGCFGKRSTREEDYRRRREQMIKQREKRLKEEQKLQKKQQQELRKKRKKKQSTGCSPCCRKAPEPVWRQPTPHNCVRHLKEARDQAIKRRHCQELQAQPSWESITCPPTTKKRIRGTQTTKEDMKRAQKAAGGGWSLFKCFGKRKKEPEADPCATEQKSEAEA